MQRQSSNPRLPGEAQDPVALHAPPPVEGHYRRHVVGHPLLGHAAVERYGGEPAREELVPGPALGVDEPVHPGAAQGGREHVELEHLPAPARHAQVLLPVELQLAAGRGLVPGMGLGPPAAVESDVVSAAIVREGVVPGHPPPPAPVQEVLVHGLLGRARHGRLLGDQRAVGVEAARPVAPAVVDVASLAPIPGDGVPVEAVAPADLAEVRLQPELPVHVQLAHDVPFFQSRSFPSVLLGGKSISTLVRLAKVRWCGWCNSIGAVGIIRWYGWCNLYWH